MKLYQTLHSWKTTDDEASLFSPQSDLNSNFTTTVKPNTPDSVSSLKSARRAVVIGAKTKFTKIKSSFNGSEKQLNGVQL